MDDERLQALINEATVDCYGEEEEFWGILAALEDELEFPLKVTLICERVKLIGLDEKESTSRRGIVARVQHKGKEYSVSLADLQMGDADSHSAAWLAAHRHWFRY
ncbi:MAG: calcium-binding protein [Candidatus Promineifilaceae bacterium]